MQKLVVIGAGMASGRMLEHMFEADPQAYEVTLFNAEPRGNYNRIMLSPVLSGDKTWGPDWAGHVGAAAAFAMTGVGLHMTQTAGLALATDRATDETRPRVVALLYVMFLLGMGLSSIIIGWLLRDFTPLQLIRVVQGAASVGILLNLIALWKQEKVRPMSRTERETARPRFRDAWADLMNGGQAGRLLAVAFLGTMGFNMQDVLLESRYRGKIEVVPVATLQDVLDNILVPGSSKESLLEKLALARFLPGKLPGTLPSAA